MSSNKSFEELIGNFKSSIEIVSKYGIVPFGLLCNLILISVCLSKSFRSLITSFYLILLSISNSLILCLLLTNILLTKDFINVSFTRFLNYFDDCLWEISAWLTALIAIDKVRSFTNKKKTFKNIPYNVIAALSLIVFSFLSNIVILFKTNNYTTEIFLIYKHSYWFAFHATHLDNFTVNLKITDSYSMAIFIKMIVFYFIFPFLISIICLTIILFKIIKIRTSLITYKVRDYNLIKITILTIISFSILNLPIITILFDYFGKIIWFLFNKSNMMFFEDLFNDIDQFHIILLNIFLVLRDCYTILALFLFILFNQLFRKELMSILKFINISDCQKSEDNSNRNFFIHAFKKTYLIKIRKEKIFTSQSQ
jgi:hypothetical protein